MSAHTTDVLELVREAQKQTLATLEQFQQVSIRAAEAAATLVPSAPWPGFTNTLPKASEVVEATFGFYGKVLESQKAYAVRLVDVATKAAEAGGNGAKKSAA